MLCDVFLHGLFDAFDVGDELFCMLGLHFLYGNGVAGLLHLILQFGLIVYETVAIAAEGA